MNLKSIDKIKDNYEDFQNRFLENHSPKLIQQYHETYQIALNNLKDKLGRDENGYKTGTALDTLFILRETFAFVFDSINNYELVKNIETNSIPNQTHKYFIQTSLISFIESLYKEEAKSFSEVNFELLVKHISSAKYTDELLYNFPVIFFLYLNRVVLTKNYLDEVIINTERVLKKSDLFQSLESLDLFLGDIHNFGKFTLKLKFKDYTFYYKPRNIEIDKLYYSILFTKLKMGNLELKILSDNYDFGLIEEISYKPNTVNSDFYFKWGRLIGFFQLCNTFDIINENVIYSENVPVLCDVECLFTPKFPNGYRDGKISKDDNLEELFELSVVNTSIIETNFTSRNTSSPLYINSAPTISFPIFFKKFNPVINQNIPENKHFGITPLETINVSQNILQGYHDFIKNDFSDIYHELEQIIRMSEFHTRVLLKHTHQYFEILDESKKGRYLTSINSFLDFFNVIMKQNIDKEVVKNERKHLMIEDVPIYTSNNKRKDLLDGNYEIVTENYFVSSFNNYIKERFEKIKNCTVSNSANLIDISVNYYTNNKTFFILKKDFHTEILSRSIQNNDIYYFLEIAVIKEKDIFTHILKFDTYGFLSGIDGILYYVHYSKKSKDIFENLIHKIENYRINPIEKITMPSILVDALSMVFTSDKINSTRHLIESIEEELILNNFEKNYDYFSGFLLTYTAVVNKNTINKFGTDKLKSVISYVYENKELSIWQSSGISHGLAGNIPFLVKLYVSSNDIFYLKYLNLYYQATIDRVNFETSEMYFDQDRKEIAIPSYSNGSIGLYFSFKFMFQNKLINNKKFVQIINFTINNIKKYIKELEIDPSILSGISGALICLKDIVVYYKELIPETQYLWAQDYLDNFDYNFQSKNYNIDSLASTSIFYGVTGIYYVNDLLKRYNQTDNILDVNFYTIYDS